MQLGFEKYLKMKAGVGIEPLSLLKDFLVTKHYPKGSFLLQKGGVCDHSFFVESGVLRLFSVDDSGKEHVIQFAPENWLIADRESMFFQSESQYFIEAIEDTTVTLVSEELLEKIAQLSPSFRIYHERILQNHIRFLQNRIHLLMSAPAEQRYLHFVSMYPDLMLRVPQWMIASYLGITAESLSRVRKELSKKR